MTDFEIMDKMAAANMDISCAPTIVQTKQTANGGLITIGVGTNAYNNIVMPPLLGQKPTHYVMLYVINKQQFDELKAQPKTDGL